MNASPLHPTLKLCKCGLITTKTGFHNHMDNVLFDREQTGQSPKDFWRQHGELPLCDDDPRVQTESALKASLTRAQKILTL